MTMHSYDAQNKSLPPQIMTICMARALFKTLKQQAQMRWMFHMQSKKKIS